MAREIEEPAGFDQARFEAFGDRMLGMFNAGCTALLASIGGQDGSCSDAMALAGAVASEELAGRAGLNERYVREWLGGMTVAGVVEYDPTARAYSLPPEHAGWLTVEPGGKRPCPHPAIHPPARTGGAGHCAVLPRRGWPLLRPLPEVSRTDR